MKRLTYFYVDTLGKYHYADQFNYGFGPVSSLDSFEENIKDFPNNKAGKLCAERWRQIIEETKDGQLKPGMRWCWFEKSPRNQKAIEKFVKRMVDAGYKVDELNLAESFA